MGYVQGYETDDGQKLAEGNLGTDGDFRRQIRNAKQILERMPNYRNHSGYRGERIVIQNKTDDAGKEPVSILWHGRGDYWTFIDAPTLDLVLEFEQYLISIDYRSPV